MIPVPYLKEILAGGLAVVIVLLGVQTFRLKMCQEKLQNKTGRVALLEAQQAHAGQQVLTLRAKLNDANKVVRDNELAGERAAAAQAAADRLAQRVAEAETELARALIESAQLKSRAENLTTCETYELVLRSIAGEDL